MCAWYAFSYAVNIDIYAYLHMKDMHGSNKMSKTVKLVCMFQKPVKVLLE